MGYRQVSVILYNPKYFPKVLVGAVTKTLFVGPDLENAKSVLSLGERDNPITLSS